MRTIHFTKLFALVCGFAILFTSCQEDDSMIAPQIESSKSILETLESFDQEISYNIYAQEESNARWGYGQGKKKGFAKRAKKVPTFFTLSTALKETGLFKTVVKNKLTVFAPTDDAFAALGLNPSNVGDVPGIENILLYHVVPGLVFAEDLSEVFVPTLNGAAVEVSLDGGVFINESEVIKANVRAINSVLHVVDQVLLPPTKTIADIVIAGENFSILEAAVIEAKLAGTLSDADANFTVFAPTDAAFVELLGVLGITAGDLLASPALSDVLLYHVLGGRVYSTDLSDGLSVEMLNGEEITFDLSGMPAIVDVNGRSIQLETTDIQATNGVIHVIKGVLAPSSITPLL
jgi:transforming growth factor-beta-induced protein